MTIAAGFVCTDGVVIAADNQHTGSTAKFDKKKIREIIANDNTFLIMTGAGESDYISMSMDLLEEKFKTLTTKNELTIAGMLRDVCVQIYRDQIVPVWTASDPNAPQVFLIIATKLATGEVVLWKISETAVSRCKHTAFIGVGAETANGLASWLYREQKDWKRTQIIAKEIITETKRTVRECGGPTNICTIPHGLLEHIRVTTIGENSEGDFFWGINCELGNILNAVIDKNVSAEDFHKSLHAFSDLVINIRSRFDVCEDGSEWLLMYSGPKRG